MAPRAALLVLWILAAAACGLTEGVGIAEKAVATFHERYDAGSFGAIFDDSTDDLRRNGSRSEFLDAMASVRTKLGSVRDTTRTAFDARIGGDGTFVTLEYETEYEHGTAVEEFVWAISDGRAALHRYDLSSRSLLP